MQRKEWTWKINKCLKAYSMTQRASKLYTNFKWVLSSWDLKLETNKSWRFYWSSSKRSGWIKGVISCNCYLSDSEVTAVSLEQMLGVMCLLKQFHDTIDNLVMAYWIKMTVYNILNLRNLTLLIYNETLQDYYNKTKA